ncbi:hypothetical protein [Hugenholtzia roseola]|uniref:hypothetical protein n=1 Tax=Hugenholtzia roseola TaxID=1002 RepID=UPI00042473F6|nr:hypothetical protein [Hugenholtzia roseola]
MSILMPILRMFIAPFFSKKYRFRYFTIFVLIGTIFGLTACLQESEDELLERSLVKIYDSVNQTRYFTGTDLMATQDGYILIGRYKDVAVEEFALLYILKVDREGKFVWEKTYPAYYLARSIHPVEGGFAIFASDYKEDIPFFLKFDAEGNLIENKPLDVPERLMLWAEKSEYDDSYLILTSNFRIIDEQTSRLIKVSSTGDVVWQREFQADKNVFNNRFFSTRNAPFFAKSLPNQQGIYFQIPHCLAFSTAQADLNGEQAKPFLKGELNFSVVNAAIFYENDYIVAGFDPEENLLHLFTRLNLRQRLQDSVQITLFDDCQSYTGRNENLLYNYFNAADADLRGIILPDIDTTRPLVMRLWNNQILIGATTKAGQVVVLLYDPKKSVSNAFSSLYFGENYPYSLSNFRIEGEDLLIIGTTQLVGEVPRLFFIRTPLSRFK